MQKEIYRLPSDVKTMMTQGFIVGAVLALIATALAFAAPPLHNLQLPVVIFVLLLIYGGTLVCLLSISPCDAHLEVTEDGISQVHPRGATVTLHWMEISSVKNNPIMQRLELYSRNRESRIHVEHQIENFAHLKRFIEAKTNV